ncbi:MAG: thioredoxin domain-containing protein [Clostridia bacterium]
MDDAPEIAAKYGVMSIPTLIVFKKGEVASKTLGLQSKQNVLNLLK